MVSKEVAVYEPPKQTRSVLLYWRLPEEWAEVLHGWVRIRHGQIVQMTSDYPCSQKATTTGQLNIILTFYEITDPPIESPLTGIPLTLLRRAITILGKTGRAQIIGVTDGEGVRFFPGAKMWD